jgi:hypothetical protein
MGEAIYYLKAQFKDGKAALKGAKRLRGLIEEDIAAYDFWQRNRGQKEPSEFWPEFKEKFPKVYRYLKMWQPKLVGGDCDNDLAGKLGLGNEGDAQNVVVEGNLVKYHAEVWHFSDWSGLVKYVKRVCLAQKAGYISDEYADPNYLVEMD